MYELLDSGEGRKLEQFGSYKIDRPSLQAIWPKQNPNLWNKSHARFTRDPDGRWEEMDLPEFWNIDIEGLKFILSPTDFGHLGIFPEQQPIWRWIQEKVSPGMQVLNLFAYSGGSTLAAAKGGAEVCHLDASKKMVAWARENAELSGLSDAPIRWIIDDARKFLKREARRGRRYDMVILDPPSYGRGSRSEIFKIEDDLFAMLESINALKPKTVLLSCHTPGISAMALENLLSLALGPATLSSFELFLGNKTKLPSGLMARWEK